MRSSLAAVQALATSVALAVLAGSAHAKIAFSNTLGSNMVLQRSPLPAVVWGWADAGVGVTVDFNGAKYPTTAAADGSWQVTLAPTKAGGPYSIAATNTKTNEVATLSNVLFGDVFLCSGQSNMQFTVAQLINATAEIALAANYPQIRIMTVGQGTASATPLPELATIAQNWSVANPATVGAGNWSEFSAVCWLFGRDLQDSLKQITGAVVPIGLVSTNWGGTPVQYWSSPDALAKCNQSLAPAVGDSMFGNVGLANSQLYNAMINPFLKMRTLGAIWYQGEANVGVGPQLGGAYYSCQFPAMIADWRVKFNLPNLWFGFVQLAPYTEGQGEPGSVNLASLRQAQLAALTLPNVGFATAADFGDVNSPFGNVHPRFKQPVGLRLANAALNQVYAQTSLPWQGPYFAGPAKGAVVGTVSTATVSFTSNSVSGGLVLHATPACPVAATSCGWWALQAPTGEWVNATAAIGSDNQSVVVSAEFTLTAAPTGVRYGYADWPVLNLYNGAGLPAIPFDLPVF